jgi:hypothetical protein
MLKSKVICLLAAPLFPILALAGEEGENSALQVMQYQSYNYVSNIESGSINPTSIIYLPIKDLAEVSAGYKWQTGDYHRLDKAGNLHGFDVKAYGIKRLTNFSFEGGISYTNDSDKDRCWNSSLYQNELNPFILADNQPSDFNTEKFRIDGRVAFRANSSITLGVNADYNVGVTSDEQDPRCETKGMRFILNPGIDWKINSKIAVGATAGINVFNETSKYTSVNTSFNYPFYLMSGLGSYYPQNGTSYQRDAKGTSWLAQGNIHFTFSPSISDYLAIGYAHENEEATDGGSTYQFKAGEYTNDKITANNRFSIKTDHSAHNITLNVESNNIEGRWFDQQSVTVNGETQYEVMNSSIKHKETRFGGGIKYRFDLLNEEGVSTFTASVGANMLYSDTKNYPEVYEQEYTRTSFTAHAMKYFDIKKAHIGVGCTGDYSTCPSSSYNFTGLELESTYTMPMYAYFTSSAYGIHGEINVKFPVKEYLLGIYLSGGTTKCTDGELAFASSPSLNTLKCGIVLSF